MLKEFYEEVDRGLEGKNRGLDNGHDRLNEYIAGIQKGIFYLIGGSSGLIQNIFV